MTRARRFAIRRSLEHNARDASRDRRRRRRRRVEHANLTRDKSDSHANGHHVIYRAKGVSSKTPWHWNFSFTRHWKLWTGLVRDDVIMEDFPVEGYARQRPNIPYSDWSQVNCITQHFVRYRMYRPIVSLRRQQAVVRSTGSRSRRNVGWISCHRWHPWEETREWECAWYRARKWEYCIYTYLRSARVQEGRESIVPEDTRCLKGCLLQATEKRCSLVRWLLQ